jgi:hypothetical protein
MGRLIGQEKARYTKIISSGDVTMGTEKDKMLNGERYNADDKEL